MPASLSASSGRKRKRENVELDYEDTLPEEYAGPVYRGTFWLISDEFSKNCPKANTPKNLSTSPAWEDEFPDQIPPSVKSQTFMPRATQGRKRASRRPAPSFAGDDLDDLPEKGPVKKKTKIKRVLHRKPRRHKPDVSTSSSDNDQALRDGQLVDLFCNHCNRSFQAKPTYRPKFMHYLVNHACSGLKRHQYVLGVKHRKCQFQCEPSQGCIFLTA